MISNRTATIAILAALSGATLLASISALVALNNGGDGAGLKMAVGYDRRAEQLIAPANLLKASARAEAARRSRAAIAQFPYDTTAWLRLAYIDSIDHGGLTPVGLGYLKRSYDLVGVDAFVGLWRVRFALENSGSLTPEVRAAVRNEVMSLWRNGENVRPLREMVMGLRNPAGRLSLALWLNRLESAVAK